MARSFGMLKPFAGAIDTDKDADIPEGVEIEFDVDPQTLDSFEVDTTTGESSAPGEDDAEASAIAQAPHGTNLATLMDEDELEPLGTDLLEMVKTDIDSRKEWYDKLKRGLERLGVYNPDDTSEHASGIARVTHPLLLEAATQFQARAMNELLPPGGPVKVLIEGEETEEVIAQGKRVEKFMNYQLTVEDRTYYDERDQMLFLLPFTGSEFDKQYYDAATRTVVSRWVRCDDFIVPYNAKTLREAPRYTHAIRLNGGKLRSVMASGFYDDVDLGEPIDTEASAAPLTVKLNELDGSTKPQVLDVDKEYTLYEMHVDMDIEGEVEATPLPYIITIDSECGKVLSIYRNWREADPLKIKRVWFTHKKFLPGFGFYGFGLLHCIGNLGDAASDILRILVDSGAFATLQGGFKSVDAKIKGDIVLEPGVWQDTEMTSDELARAFYTPPWKEPSQVLENLLGKIVASGEKFASTTETMTGDAATTGPVGTMVAQIEQGSKVFSGIHKRLHKAFGDEFIHIATLNGENLSDIYPYKTGQADQHVLRTDFDGRVDIIPVSDPNIFSSAQRIAMAQSALQLSVQMPDLGDRREAAVQLLTAMRFPNPERIFPKPVNAERADPLNEGSLVLLGRPIKAFLDQDHPSHITVHQGQMQGLPPANLPLMQAHIGEHMAMEQYKKFAAMGVPLPPMKWDAERKNPMMPKLDPQQEAQIAVASAQAMTQVMAQIKAEADKAEAAKHPPPTTPTPEEAMQQRQQDATHKEQLKNAAFQSDQQRKNAATSAQVDRQDALGGLSPANVKQAQEFITQNNLPMSARELALLSKAMGTTFEKVVEALSRMTMGGQGGSQFEQLTNFKNNPARFV